MAYVFIINILLSSFHIMIITLSSHQMIILENNFMPELFSHCVYYLCALAEIENCGSCALSEMVFHISFKIVCPPIFDGQMTLQNNFSHKKYVFKPAQFSFLPELGARNGLIGFI